MEAAGTPNPTVMRQVEKSILLQSIDGLWREHLVTLDHLSKVVGWRGMAQRDPLNEYKQEAYELFQALLTNLRELVTTQLSHVELQIRPPVSAPDLSGLRETHIDPLTGENDADGDDTFDDSLGATGEDPSLKPLDPALMVGVSRNAPCPCGSGKKFKHCHGAF
jgi:preprotein translocase subunit SecA